MRKSLPSVHRLPPLCVFRRKRSVIPEFPITPPSEAALAADARLVSAPDAHLLVVDLRVVSHDDRVFSAVAKVL
jgi:hypothetical protein